MSKKRHDAIRLLNNTVINNTTPKNATINLHNGLFFD